MLFRRLPLNNRFGKRWRRLKHTAAYLCYSNIKPTCLINLYIYVKQVQYVLLLLAGATIEPQDILRWYKTIG